MSNVLSDEKRQQIIVLGRLGWSLRRIEQATGVRRETASNYLKAAGIEVYPAGRRDRGSSKPAINKVITDPGRSKPAIKVTTDSEARPRQSISACEPYRELIEQGLGCGRNAMAIWQDLVSQHSFGSGYQSVKRFVNKIRPSPTAEARPVILTGPGEEAQVDYGQGPMVRDPQAGK